MKKDFKCFGLLQSSSQFGTDTEQKNAIRKWKKSTRLSRQRKPLQKRQKDKKTRKTEQLTTSRSKLWYRTGISTRHYVSLALLLSYTSLISVFYLSSSANAAVCTKFITDVNTSKVVIGQPIDIVMTVRNESTPSIARINLYRNSSGGGNKPYTINSYTVDANSYGFGVWTLDTPESLGGVVRVWATTSPYYGNLASGKTVTARINITPLADWNYSNSWQIQIYDNTATIMDCGTTNKTYAEQYQKLTPIASPVTLENTPDVNVANTPLETTGGGGGGTSTAQPLTAQELHDMGKRWTAWAITVGIGYLFIKKIDY